MNKSFTFIELLFTVTIVAIISALSLPRYNDFTERKRLEGEAKQLVDVIELAKKKSITSDLNNSACIDFNGYGVDVNATSYTLNFICAGSWQILHTYAFSTKNTIDATTVGKVIFVPIDGTVNTLLSTSQSFTLKNSSLSKSIDITISRTGVITIGAVY